MTKTSATALVLVACAAFSHAALAQYKYVGPDGRVTYSDQPPPSNARVVEEKKLNAAPTPSSALPFEILQAKTKYPVTIYTGDKCTPCDDGRNYLRNRGVPFDERTVSSNDDIKLFTQQSPDGTAPVLVVGTRKSVGFAQGAWSSLLDSAGYPQTSALPREYQNPAPTPLSPNTKPPAQNVTQAAATGASRPATSQGAAVPGSIPSSPPANSSTAAPTNAPPGFRF